MARFTLPRDLYHGKGSLDELKNLKGSKAAVVVGGGSMKRFGFLDRVVENLKAAGMEVLLIENVEPDPSVETVMRGAKEMRQFQPDWIVAMGGGSPSISPPCGQKPGSAPFLLPPAQPRKSPPSASSPITKRASNILWPTLISPRTWPLWTRIWRKKCPKS